MAVEGSGRMSDPDSDPWAGIPARYNLGVGLTRGNVEAGRGGRVCLYWENSLGERRQYTYAEMDELTSRFASALTALGVARGDRVLLRLPNLPEFYIAALGVAKLGGVFIPSSTQFRQHEVEYRLRDSGAVAAISTTRLAAEIEESWPNSPVLKHLITVPSEDVPTTGEQREFWQLVRAGDHDFTPADTASDDLAFIAYTSGTTGDPKGVVHLQRYPLSYDSLIRLWHDYRDDDVCACPAELGWLLPVASTFLYAMRAGLSIVLYHPVDGRFRAPAWFDLIGRYKISNFVATPTIYRMLIADPGFAAADLSSLRHGVSAGEPLPPDTLAAVRERFGFAPLDGIGMTECMVYCFNRAGEPITPGSCGRPAPGCAIRLMDEDSLDEDREDEAGLSLREVGIGQEGVLCVRRDTHPGMMQEYWNKPAQTAEIFRGPWYYSGDVMIRDANDRYWFQGRNDDVIKASGYRISPFEVESCVLEHPAVLEAAAVAADDPVRGCVVKTVIVLREGRESSDALAAEIQEFVKQRIAGYKYPRRVEFVHELPKTPSGKIKRRLLRE